MTSPLDDLFPWLSPLIKRIVDDLPAELKRKTGEKMNTHQSITIPLNLPHLPLQYVRALIDHLPPQW